MSLVIAITGVLLVFAIESKHKGPSKGFIVAVLAGALFWEFVIWGLTI